MAVSEREREYMRRLGALKEESHQEAAAAHARVPVSERLRRSWALYEANRASARLEERQDDPSPFYDRARALGLYRG